MCRVEPGSEQRPYLLANMLAAPDDCLVLENLGKEGKYHKNSQHTQQLCKYRSFLVVNFLKTLTVWTQHARI